MSFLDKYEKLYEEYYPQVYSYLLKLTHDSALADELTQETFFKVLAHIGEYRGQTKFYVWACSIAKNAYYDHLRKQKRFIKLQEDVLIDETIPSHEETAEDKDLCRAIIEKLHELDEPYREVFWMRAFAELSFKEIARIHGKSESWARVTYYRARLILREAIE